MNRQTRSFLITLAVYLSVGALIIYQWNDDGYSDKQSPDKSAARVCFSVISQEVPAHKEPQKVEKKVEKKKVVKKKKVVRKVEKEVEKVVQKETVSEVPRTEAPEEPVAEATKEIIEEPAETTETAQPEEVPTEVMTAADQSSEKAAETVIQKEIDQELLQARQDRFLAHLVKKINRNKSYPRIARRRGMEGDVEVAFHILSDGSVNNIKLVSGKKVFRRSAIEAISKSFPVKVDSAIFDFPKEFSVTLAYVLK